MVAPKSLAAPARRAILGQKVRGEAFAGRVSAEASGDGAPAASMVAQVAPGGVAWPAEWAGIFERRQDFERVYGGISIGRTPGRCGWVALRPDFVRGQPGGSIGAWIGRVSREFMPQRQGFRTICRLFFPASPVDRILLAEPARGYPVVHHPAVTLSNHTILGPRPYNKPCPKDHF
jgi:hypothetical protein